MDNQAIQVKIISPKEIIFEGPAWAVSSKNSDGNFDILPKHANFITLVENEPILIRKHDSQEVQSFKFELAIIYASNNKINIYTDIQLTFNSA